MKLYYSPGACSLSPHIILREGGFSFTLEEVDLKSGTYSGGDFSRVNPKGYVPVLEFDDGERLTEGVAIVQYLADIRPQLELVPPMDTLERARCLEWLVFTSTEIHKPFGALWNSTSSEGEKARARESLRTRIDFVNAKLEGPEYLAGNRFSAADAYMFTVLRWGSVFDIHVDQWKNVAALMSRVGDRPKLKEALRAEGLIASS